MSKIKNYKGINIYVSTDKQVYCDMTNKSSDIKDADIISVSLAVVENIIDDVLELSEINEKYLKSHSK